MGKTKKRLFWFIGLLGVFLTLFIVFILFLPEIVNLDPIKKKVIAEFSNQTGTA